MKTQYDLSKLTPEIVQELDKEPNIHEMFVRIGVVKNQLEVGKWYKSTLIEDVFIFLKDKEKGRYGFDSNGWYNVDDSNEFITMDDRWIVATPEEVTKRLIEYAKSIGMVKGAKIIDIYNGKTKTDTVIISSNKFDYEGVPFGEYQGKMALRDSNGSILFINGIWATIIKEETYIKIPLSEIKATPNYYELGALVMSIANKY
jgi:hypothetical protein